MKFDEDLLHRAHLQALERLVASHGGVVVRPDRQTWKPLLQTRAASNRHENARSAKQSHDALAWMSPVATSRVPFEGLLSPSYYVGETLVELLGAMWRGVVAAVRYMRARHLMHRTMRELCRLDDRLLRDVGLHRGDVCRVAYELAFKDRAHPASSAQ